MKSYIKLQNMLGFGDTHLLSALLEKFKSPAGILSASDEELLACGLKKSQVKRKNSMSDKEAEKIINKCQKNNVWIIPYGHKNFPKKLMNIETPPVVIYGIGEIFDFDKNLSLALVGTRKISEFGKRAAFSLSARLSLANSIIISGGAIGCDSFAHLGALAAGGKTVAVTGGGVLSPYLKANKKLRDDIIKYGGALISEFTPDYVPRFKNSFQIRNRIIAALSQAVVVIEAPAGSGAIITANAAADIGRDVYVLSGKPNELQYEGSNRLINEGAFLLQSPRQIIENFKFKYNDISIESMDIISGNRLKELYLKAIARYTEKEKNKILSKTKEEKTTKASDKKEIEKFLLGNELIVFKAFQKEEMLSDEIIEKTMLGAAEVIKTLTLLEIKGVIEALPGSRYKLK